MTCPICQDQTDPRFRPFCSKRCAEIDLGKWLGGEYAVPSRDPEDIENEGDENETESWPAGGHGGKRKPSPRENEFSPVLFINERKFR